MLRLTLELNGKNCIFRHEFYKNCSKSQCHEYATKILDICNSCVIWKYHPSDMYIPSHLIGLIDVTE